MPGFQIDGKGPLALATALIYIAGGIVKDLEHGHDAVGSAVAALDKGTLGPDFVDGKADAASTLGNQCGLFQSFVDAVDTVFAHTQKKTTG